MTAEVAPLATEWWRAERYDIVHGTHIRPAAQARMEPYEALARYDEFWIGAGRAREAYLALLNLDLQDTDAVLTWCSSFGLLGILHHRLIAAYFWPTWESRLVGRLEQLKPHQTVLGAAESFDSFPKRVRIGEMTPLSEDGAADLGRPLRECELSDVLGPGESFGLRRPHVLVRAVWSNDPEEVGTVEGYGQFFPDVDGIPAWAEEQATRHESLPWAIPRQSGAKSAAGQQPRAQLNFARYPLPDSTDFKRLYAEPRYLFHQIVHGFTAAVRSLNDQQDDERATRTAVALKGHWVPIELGVALRQVSPTVAWSDEQGWVHAWRAPSLLAAMSVMAVQDLTLKGGRLPTCAWCSKRFFTDRSDRRYCTPACGNAFRVAKHRARAQASEDTPDPEK